MKKYTIILAVFIGFILTGKAIAAPVYTDEIPKEYIEKVKSLPKYNLSQNLPIYNEDNATQVKVYSPENIRLKYKTIRENAYLYHVNITNMSINDKVKFLIAEDVYQNNKLLIKKDTPAIGVVREANIAISNYGAPPEIQISMFTTKDVNNNTIELYGTVLNDYSGFIQIPSHAINKNKIYTLYYK